MNEIKKVLIADDDAGIVDSLSMMLQFEGYEVSSTLNGAAVLKLNENLPDLLLLDIWMSGVDGRDICKQLKLQPHTSKIPILMISASKDIRSSALAAGADDFLAKPFEMKELLQKIAAHIN